MIAKLITYGKDRPHAIELMKQALKQYKVVGLNNNLRFLKRVFDDPIFQQGDYDTGFIEQNIDTLLNKAEDIDSFDLVTAAIARDLKFQSKINLPDSLKSYRNVKSQKQTHKVSVKETSISK